MVYGVLRLINFAHSEIFMIGTVAALFTVTSHRRVRAAERLALIGMLILLAAGRRWSSPAARDALELIAYRPLRKRGAPGWPR